MKSRSLTAKQQEKARAKVFKLLADIGFQYANRELTGGYWWHNITGTDFRVCVGFGVLDQCLGGRTNWVWQTAKLDEEPLFGYSGSTSIGAEWAEWGTVERIMDITLERFYEIGLSRGLGIEKAERLDLVKNIKGIIDQVEI